MTGAAPRRITNTTSADGHDFCRDRTRRRSPPLDDDDDDDESEGEDEAGSLVDFIVDDEGEEGDDEAQSDDGSEACSEPPATKEEAIRRDLDGISNENIVSGKRTRKQTTFYEQSVFNTEEYRRMMLCDVPKDELDALENESEGEEESSSEGDDASFKEGDAEESEEEDDSDDPAEAPEEEPEQKEEDSKQGGASKRAKN